MLKRILATFPILLLALSVGGCDLVGDILEFGFWVGVIVVALVALLIWWIIRMFRGRQGGPPRA